jgi:replication initiation protein RepC
MDYEPISPFMRPISHAHLSTVEDQVTSLPKKPVNKWELLRELSKAQVAFGVTERDLTVLQGLLSFFPDDALGGNADMTVFPSNKAICERLNGMPNSTMRRHLSRLIEAGLIMRRDSPNGKRYVRKIGEERVVFGFDLTPLYRRSEAVARAAEAAREAEERLKRLREVVSLMRRDLAALSDFGKEYYPGLSIWDEYRDQTALVARALRRKLQGEELIELRDRLADFLDHARNVIDGPETQDLNTDAVHIEHHYHNSNTDTLESEPGLEKSKAPDVVQNEQPEDHDLVDVMNEKQELPKIPLHLVLTSCPSLKTFYDGEIRHWHQLYDAASHVRPAMGISVSAWEDAQRCMGPEQASIVVVAMLERFSEIRSPGGYLRTLSSKAAAGEFSCGPMVMALIHKRKAA